MSVKICGHLIRWHKTIKIYRFWRYAAVALLLCAPIAIPAHADPQKDDVATRLAHTAPAAGNPSMPCDTGPMALNTRHERPSLSAQKKQQATTPSPAHILALALGVRTISGPVERNRNAAKALNTKISSSSFDRRTPLMPQDKDDIRLLSMKHGKPQPMME